VESGQSLISVLGLQHLESVNPGTENRMIKTWTPSVPTTDANTGPKTSMPGSLNPVQTGSPQSNLEGPYVKQQPYDKGK